MKKHLKDIRTRYRYRSAIWGHFVSAKFAKEHPRTTVKETTIYLFKRGKGFVLASRAA